MSRMVSIGTKIEQLAGLLGTHDVTEWESRFIESVYAWAERGKRTSGLTEKQIAVIERIWEKHFA